jgi:hypothetical protein
MTLFRKITRQAPKMWGPSIVGYGSYHYTYDSGRSGDAPLAAFAIRGRTLVIYKLADDAKQKPLLSKLGKHTSSKSCLYIKQLADIDMPTLEKIVRSGIAEVQRRYS